MDFTKKEVVLDLKQLADDFMETLPALTLQCNLIESADNAKLDEVCQAIARSIDKAKRFDKTLAGNDETKRRIPFDELLLNVTKHPLTRNQRKGIVKALRRGNYVFNANQVRFPEKGVCLNRRELLHLGLKVREFRSAIWKFPSVDSDSSATENENEHGEPVNKIRVGYLRLMWRMIDCGRKNRSCNEPSFKAWGMPNFLSERYFHRFQLEDPISEALVNLERGHCLKITGAAKSGKTTMLANLLQTSVQGFNQIVWINGNEDVDEAVRNVTGERFLSLEHLAGYSKLNSLDTLVVLDQVPTARHLPIDLFFCFIETSLDNLAGEDRIFVDKLSSQAIEVAKIPQLALKTETDEIVKELEKNKKISIDRLDRLVLLKPNFEYSLVDLGLVWDLPSSKANELAKLYKLFTKSRVLRQYNQNRFYIETHVWKALNVAFKKCYPQQLLPANHRRALWQAIEHNRTELVEHFLARFDEFVDPADVDLLLQLLYNQGRYEAQFYSILLHVSISNSLKLPDNVVRHLEAEEQDVIIHQKCNARRNLLNYSRGIDDVSKLDKDSNGHSPLHRAVLRGDQASTRKLLNLFSLAERDNEGLTPLDLAVILGDSALAKTLLGWKTCFDESLSKLADLLGFKELSNMLQKYHEASNHLAYLEPPISPTTCSSCTTTIDLNHTVKSFHSADSAFESSKSLSLLNESLKSRRSSFHFAKTIDYDEMPDEFCRHYFQKYRQLTANLRDIAEEQNTPMQPMVLPLGSTTSGSSTITPGSSLVPVSTPSVLNSIIEGNNAAEVFTY